MEDDINIREYLMVVLRYWWIMAIALLLTIAFAISLVSRQQDVYESRARLLITQRTSEQLVSEGSPVSTLKTNPFSSALSIETLSALATANDLLMQVIEQEDLKDENGDPWPVESLSGMLKPRVETFGGTEGVAGGSKSWLPLLTMVVRGGDPPLVHRIARAWVDLFVAENAELFSAKTARSFEFVSKQYTEAESIIVQLENDRRQLLKETPLDSLEAQLQLYLEELDRNEEAMLTTKANLLRANDQLADTLDRLREISVEGRWVGFISERDMPVLVTKEQKAIVDTKASFQSLNEDIGQLRLDSEITSLEAQLSSKKELLSQHIHDLDASDNIRDQLTTRLSALQDEIKDQPEFHVLSKSVDDSTLWQQLGLDPDKETWDKLRDIGLKTEEINESFVWLTTDIIETIASLEEQTELSDVLTKKVNAAGRQIGLLEPLVSKHNLTISLLTGELTVLQRIYETQRETFEVLQERKEELEGEIRSLGADLQSYNELVSTNRTSVDSLADLVGSAGLRMSRIDRELEGQATSLVALGLRLAEARMAKAEEDSAVRIVESPMEPRIPLVQNNYRTFIILLALGFSMGIVVVLATHWIRTQRASQNPEKGMKGTEGDQTDS